MTQRHWLVDQVDFILDLRFPWSFKYCSDRLKVIRHTLQTTRSEKMQNYSTVVWYSLMLTMKSLYINHQDHISLYSPVNF